QAEVHADESRTAEVGAAKLIDVATAWNDAASEQRQQMATLLIQPRGLAWQHRGKQIIAVKPYEEFVAGFTLALGWKRQGLWLVPGDDALPLWIGQEVSL
ncbi:MAG TPA: hypothetical protein VKB76_13120, partial [Ktedonobacterales bacterium]|nr:hypothetical protein [Ktedonobacterales bacterium]